MEKLKLSMIEKSVNLSESIKKIMKTSGLKVGVKEICEKYSKELERGVSDEALYESFISEMDKFASISAINEELAAMKYSASKDKNNIAIKRAFYNIDGGDSPVANMVESAVANYLVTKTPESIAELKDTCSLFSGRKSVQELLEAVDTDIYTKKINGTTVIAKLNESANPKERLYSQEEVDKMIADKVNESKAAAEAAATKLTKLSQLEDKVNLYGTINKLMENKDCKRNATLMEFCEGYKNSLVNGKSQYQLYEAFINGLSRWNFLNAVDTELSAMKDRVAKYKQEIDLTQILETMKVTTSYYIVPLIEEAVVNYMASKNPATLTQLKMSCDSFLYDPYVKDIMNIVNMDNSRMYIGESIDRNPYVHEEAVYSPIQYIKENETVFCVDGVYYDKKGDNITKLDKASVPNLKPEFRAVCEAVNNDYVTYDEARGAYKVYSKNTNDIAYVNESIIVNGEKVAPSTLTDIFIGSCYYNGTTDFYKTIKVINEQFGIVAPIEFVKRVVLNEGNKAVNIFKVKKNIGMSLVNEDGKSEFYRNINPIQCRNMINEHMEIRVDNLFEGVLPNQKKVEEDIEDTKKSYEDTLAALKEKRESILGLKETAEDEEQIDDIIKSIDDEISRVESDYKEYQTQADDFLNGKGGEGDGNTGGGDADDEKNGDGTTEKDKPASDEVKNDVSSPIDNTEGGEGGQDASTHGEGDGEKIEDYRDGATEFNSILDIPVASTEGGDKGFDIIDVSFKENVKTNKKSRNGVVTIKIPMISSNGDVHNEIKTVSFSLDDDKNPIVNNDYMPRLMYNAIIDAISASPDLDVVDMETPVEGGEVPSETITPAEPPVDTPAPVVDTPSAPVVDTPDAPKETDATSDISTPSEPDVNGGDSGETPIDSLNKENDIPTLGDEGDGADDRETPAEVELTSIGREQDEAYVEGQTFPIKLGLKYDELEKLGEAPETLKAELDECGIAHHDAKDKQDNRGIVITLKTKADLVCLRRHLEKTVRLSKEAFYNAFPELRCFESLNFSKADVLYKQLFEGTIEIGIKVEDKDLVAAVEEEGIKYDDADGLKLVANNAKEFDSIISFLADYKEGLDEGDELRAEIEQILGDVSPSTYELVLPYDGALISKLDKDGIEYEDANDDVVITITDEKCAQKVLDIADELGIEDDAIDELKENLEDGGLLNEGFVVTIEDTETKKKVTVNTDELDDEGKKDDENKDGDSSFGEDTQLYDTKDQAQEAGANNGNNQGGDATQQQEGETPKKKKFVFKKKRLHEGKEIEYSKVNVGDKVKYHDAVGDVTGKRMDGKFIVIVKGETVIAEEGELKLVNPKLDLVDYPHKFDASTQAQID